MHDEEKKMKKKIGVLIFACIVIVIIDLASKIVVHENMTLGEERVVIENFFNLTYVRNYGAAFGFMRGMHEGFREFFFMTITPIFLLVILSMMRTLPDNDRISVWALSSVFAGAIGNYIDRIRLGYVIDFLDFYLPKGVLPFGGGFPQQNLHWPAFNVADMAIVCGVLVLAFVEVTRHKQGKQKTA
jgi:signal peptidase II